MRTASLIIPAALLIGLQLSLAASLSQPTQPIAHTDSIAPFTDGRIFNIDGKTQYFAGTNSWWLSYLTKDADVETAASEIAETGFLVTRVWGFGNVNAPTNSTIYFQLLDNTTNEISFNYGSNGITRLDAAIYYAEKYNLKIVLALLNNWDSLGGINIYSAYFGCNATTFYTDENAQTAYRNYISFIINRYKYSPAIFAWELCNEPRCEGCPSSIIYDWAASTSAYIKSLDPFHLVALGDEGWLCSGGDGSYAYSCANGVDFALNIKIPTLDYGTFHLYPNQWGYNYTWGNTWIEEHSSIGAQNNKAVVAEEYGVQITQANKTSIEAQWQETILATGIAYDSFWQFNTTFPYPVDESASYGILYGTAQYWELGFEHARAMKAKKVNRRK